MNSYGIYLKVLKQKGRLIKNFEKVKVHIEGLSPFIIFLINPPDNHIEKLLWGFPSYVVFYRFEKEEEDFFKEIIELILKKHKSVFLVEISQNIRQKADIGIYLKHYGDITDVVDVLLVSLSDTKLYKHNLNVKVYKQRKSFFLKRRNIHYLNLSINPPYYDRNRFYPYIFRKFHHGFSVALKKAIYTYLRKYTALKPIHYFSIGKRIFNKRVWNIDKKLSQIADSFDFILSLTPVNVQQAWEHFKKNKFSIKPQFLYRPLSFEISHLKRQLFNLPIDEIEDPTLYEIFSSKRDEVDLQLTILESRDKGSVLWASAHMYGTPDDNIINVAKRILDIQENKVNNHTKISADSLLKMAQEEINFYKKLYPGFNPKVKIRSDIVSKAIVSDGNLYIYKYSSFTQKEAISLLNHEIGTHILTYINGKTQKLSLLHVGLNGYEEMQEGLAIIAEYLSDSLSINRLRVLSARVIAVDSIIKGADFIEVFRLLRNYGFEEKDSFMIATRVFRGGGFVKDAIYLRGFLRLLEIFRDIDDIYLLYTGKYSFEHIPFIKELVLRGVVYKPAVMPKYIIKNDKKLQRLKTGLNIDTIIKDLK